MAGYQYSTGDIEPPKIRELAGAENGLLVRNGGELNLVYDTFLGPTYQTNISSVFNDTATYNSSKIPIWKVGEVFYPEKFYEFHSSLKDEIKNSFIIYLSCFCNFFVVLVILVQFADDVRYILVYL